jgi:aminopeptidase N
LYINSDRQAHTYFGDLVVIRHFEHTWLKEGWATYMEAVWLEENDTAEEFQYEMLLNSRSYAGETERYMRPMVTRVYDCSWDMFDSHTYPGCAWRIHMIRKKVGDAAFWSGVQCRIFLLNNHSDKQLILNNTVARLQKPKTLSDVSRRQVA